MSRVAVVLVLFVAVGHAVSGAFHDWHLVAKSSLLKNGVFAANQGIATDGTHLFLNSEQMIFKLDPSLNDTMARNLHMIPAELVAQGYDHVGDIQYVNGEIHGPVEEGTYTRPVFMAWNATTLEFLRKMPAGDAHLPQSHCSWVAYWKASPDPKKATHFSSEFDNVTHLYVYNSEMEQTLLKLDDGGRGILPLMAVQGGEFNPSDGLLYLTSSSGPFKQPIYVIDATKGTVLAAIPTDTGTESEGVTFLDLRHMGYGYMHFLNGLGHPLKHQLYHWDDSNTK